ncbi:MAG: hypothetical protein UY72_C0032G0003 [Candidatus Uhrbacteria bacterium GW2011_GWD2_52_7]|uniref:Uncharacterized protein n=1 Tax=Candidatus Uhrbacteria bacterium GW2011_GWD2_52_7 TaxID=1618989 RepID=A0A0G1ZNV2_9BACT|nr:MAG: hypothetical protein UY72_C0032G0003 [Candidatus Uhrbacteria bacterium GW2011_GWD2_52_7]
MSTALVRLSSPPVAPPTTVFAEFYAKVVHMLDAGTATSTSGAVVWTAQIVNTMLRDGAWPLVLAASTVIGKQPVTNDDVMNVLGRLDRVLSVGIPLHYGSVDAAVRAFVDVLAVIDRALAFGLRPGMTLSPDAWRMTATVSSTVPIRTAPRTGRAAERGSCPDFLGKDGRPSPGFTGGADRHLRKREQRTMKVSCRRSGPCPRLRYPQCRRSRAWPAPTSRPAQQGSVVD